MNIKLTTEQHKNLIEFLLRVNLTGREAIPFMDLLGAINKGAMGIADEKKKNK